MRIVNFAARVFIVLILSVSGILSQEIPVSGDQIDTGQPGLEESAKSDGELPAPELISSNYAFSPLSGIPLEDMSSGTTQLLGPGSNDDNTNIVSIGFLFRFEGATVTFFGANTNGFVRLGGTAPTGVSNVNQIDSTTNSPKIAPFWDDLCVGSSGKVHYKRTGAPGSQKLVIEWKNMKITRGGACDGSGAGTFQLWLFEHTGVIQFVYGTGMVAAPNDGGYSVGMQSGPATNFASVSTASGTVDHLAANNAQTGAILSGTSYVFTPNLPATPTNGTVTNLTHTSLQLNWIDNADNEVGYYIRRSTTGASDSYIHLGTLPANSTSFADSGLSPSTQYFYIVNAISDSAVSNDLTFTPTTNPSVAVSSTAAGGLWSSPSTWSNGIVPSALDTVTIVSGATVTIDTSAVAGTLTVGSGGGSPATLTFSATTAASLTVAQDVSILANNIFASADTGSITTHVLTLSGNLTNDGTLDFSTNNNTAGASIVFTGAPSRTFGGTGAVTDIRVMTVNKGNSFNNILELAPSNFTVRGAASESNGYLTLTNGTIKISGTFLGLHRTFAPGTPFTFSKGVWLNNPNYSVTSGGAFSVNYGGLFRITNGVYNVDGAMTTSPGSTVIIEGGFINLAAGFGLLTVNDTLSWNFTMTGGTLLTCIRAEPVPGICFNLSQNWSGTFSGGDVVIQNDSSGTSYRVEGGPGIVTGGATVHFGNAQTIGASGFIAVGRMPGVVLDTAAGNHTLYLNAPITGIPLSSYDMTIGPGGLFDIENFSFNFLGTNLVNNGAIKVNDVNSNLVFGDGSNTNITYSGSGVTSSPATRLTAFCGTLTFDQSSNIRLRNLNINSGNVIHANKLTLGNNDNTVNTITFGTPAGLPPTGTLDTSPVFELGTGGQALAYLGPVGHASRTTGPEINPTRILTQLTNDINGTLTVAGGDLTISNTLVLTRGVVAMGSSKLIVNGGITRTIGYVDGPLKWRLATPATFTFPVGQGAYSPVIVAVTSFGINPSYVTITPVDSTLPGLFAPTAVSRYWKVLEEGDLTVRLTFTYDNSDVNGNEANYQLWRSTGGPPVQSPGSTGNPGANTMQSAAGLTDFSGDWGIGEGTSPGMVSVSGSVLTSGGAGIRNALVTISGGNLPSPVTFQTGQFGTYSFTGLQGGETYTISVSAKRYRFTPASQQITPLSDLTNVNFVANPQEEF